MEEFARRLRALRKEMYLSPSELATELGVTHASISRWENWRMAINSENIIKLAKFFQVSSDFLLGLTDNREMPPVSD